MPLPLLLILAGVAAVAGVGWFLRTPSGRTSIQLRSIPLRRTLIVSGLLVLLLLFATGRLPLLLGLIGALVALAVRLLPLLHYAPLIQRLWRQLRPQSAGSASGSRSAVEARFLRMWLDHGSGAIDGEVLEGTWRGQRLSELQREQLVRLYRDYRAADPESAALLQSYLDRVHGPGWRAATDPGGVATPGAMTSEEACQILGLSPGPDRDQVIEAHRRLIQKLHPDRGGSDYLAAKINQAKDVLLGRA